MQTADDVTNYKPAELNSYALNLRVRKSTKDALDDVVRLWQEFAKARGEDYSGLDRSHVARQLLEAGLAAEFSAFGGRPADEAAWREVIATIRKTVKR